jgi:Family of unknown function (DUF6335)
MARRKTGGRPARRKRASKARTLKRSVKRPKTSRRPAKRGTVRKPARKAKKKAARKAPKKTVRSRRAQRPVASVSARPKRARVTPAHVTPPRLARERRTLEEILPTPPSSLDMDRRGSAVRTGRAEMAQLSANHANMTPSISAGDVDVDVEDAYFSGDEAPGGDNPTPDQEVVDEIGKALGVEYQDGEELRASDKVADRDKRRWELDPASSEDYRNRKR